MKHHFLFNVPSEFLENGSTNTFITIRATQVFNSSLIEIENMPLYLIASFKNPIKMMAVIEAVVKEKIEAAEQKKQQLASKA